MLKSVNSRYILTRDSRRTDIKTKQQDETQLLELPEAELRSLFRASQRALLQNQPLVVPIAALEPAATLSKAELDALDKVGLSTKPWRDAGATDPLAQSIVNYMALIETSFTTANVARMLNVDVTRIRQRLRERSLFGFDHEGEWRLPRFQFERNKTVLGLASVLEALPIDLNPLDVAEWFMAPNLDLEIEKSDRPLSPRAWLLSGHDPEPVIELARQL